MKRKELFRILIALNLITIIGSSSVFAAAQAEEVGIVVVADNEMVDEVLDKAVKELVIVDEAVSEEVIEELVGEEVASEELPEELTGDAEVIEAVIEELVDEEVVIEESTEGLMDEELAEELVSEEEFEESTEETKADEVSGEVVEENAVDEIIIGADELVEDITAEAEAPIDLVMMVEEDVSETLETKDEDVQVLEREVTDHETLEPLIEDKADGINDFNGYEIPQASEMPVSVPGGMVISDLTATAVNPERVEQETPNDIEIINTPLVEAIRPIEVNLLQISPVSANNEPLNPQVLITGDFDKENMAIIIVDQNGNEVGRYQEQVEGDGIIYDFSEISEDGIYTMYIQGSSVDGQEVVSKYIFTINQNGTSFCHDEEKANGYLTEVFVPQIKMENVDAITVLSCMINGEEVPYILNQDNLTIAPELLKAGRNKITLVVKDAAGNISEMKPWEFELDKVVADSILETVVTQPVKGGFWMRMLHKIMKQ